MTNERMRDTSPLNMLSWSLPSTYVQHEHDAEEDAAAEADEPPDQRHTAPSSPQFKRTIVCKHANQPSSLLTKALHSDNDVNDVNEAGNLNMAIEASSSRRRSMVSNISFASTADLTSDTGFTSPARTTTPSPPPPVFQLGPMNIPPGGGSSNIDKVVARPQPVAIVGQSSVSQLNVPTTATATSTSTASLPKKRCIQFACAKPNAERKPAPSPVSTTSPALALAPAPGPAPTTAVPASQPAPTQSVQLSSASTAAVNLPDRKRCIKFACPSKPAGAQSAGAPPSMTPPTKTLVSKLETSTPSTVQKANSLSPSNLTKVRSPSTGRSRRSLTPRAHPQSPVITRKKYLNANSYDLSSENLRFHEFASDEPQEDEWIRQGVPAYGRPLTINDTFKKENEIRRLGKEAEEEAEQEEAEEEGLEDADGEEENADDEEDDQEENDEDENDMEADNSEEDADDNLSAYGSDESDGYKTDNEIGFADSDEEEGGGGDLDDLWTHGPAPALHLSGATPVNRRASDTGNQTDSSICSDTGAHKRNNQDTIRARRIKIRPGTPELPDSTDFVCGTLDEDRPLEEAYISCMAQKKREKLHLIPQDIDPSFPTSEPEEDDAGSHLAGHESDEHVWIHGELEDLHHLPSRSERRKKKGDVPSPKRFHSPPPRRPVSPAPKGRGRSPRRPLDYRSPRRLLSPAPISRVVKSALKSPPTEAMGFHPHGAIHNRTLAFQPGIVQTKSLPKASAMFPHALKGQRRRQAAHTGASGHVRGAIDIVKGLEQKRQRRREKYIQKHCERARKGQVHEKRPLPGQGMERMRELGLQIAGKQPTGNYVLSV